MARRANTPEAPTEIEAPAVKGVEVRKHSATVTVACKIPQGLVLQLQHTMKRPMPTGRGMENDFQMVDVNVFGGPKYVVNGPAIPAQGGVPDGYVIPRIEGGFALTEIPRDFWESWKTQNEQSDFMTSGMIFAYGDISNTKADAREHENKMSGLEPISRDLDEKGRMKDRRVPKPITTSIARISPDADRDAERRGQSA